MRQSLHVHSVLDDGKSTMEEMVLSAIEHDLEGIGFSGHSYLPFGEDWTMSEADEDWYNGEIDRLRKEYGEKIKIYRGLELDTMSSYPQREYEYLIGSCHNVKKDGKVISVDESPEILLDGIAKYFGGRPELFEDAYFEEVAKIDRVDIQGHFDLLLKFNDRLSLFREDRYMEKAKMVMALQNSKGLIFEINTGAMSRGYMDVPYPSERMLYELKKLDGRITITADVHNAKDIDYAYDEALYLARASRFSKIWIFNGREFVAEYI